MRKTVIVAGFANLKTLSIRVRDEIAQVRSPIWKETHRPPEYSDKSKFLHNLVMIGMTFTKKNGYFFRRNFHHINFTL